MKIIDLSAFLALPPGTLFAKYAPCFFDGLSIKGDTLTGRDGNPIDFCYQQIVDAIEAHDSGEFFDLLDQSKETGNSVTMDFDCQMRDGCFEREQLFAVFERADVTALIGRLSVALSEGYGEPHPFVVPQDGGGRGEQ